MHPHRLHQNNYPLSTLWTLQGCKNGNYMAVIFICAAKTVIELYSILRAFSKKCSKEGWLRYCCAACIKPCFVHDTLACVVNVLRWCDATAVRVIAARPSGLGNHPVLTIYRSNDTYWSVESDRHFAQTIPLIFRWFVVRYIIRPGSIGSSRNDKKAAAIASSGG